MHIASFAGIAPVNNPVISVAVIMDFPKKGPSYYGTAVSAPVFAEVAQQVLEYLGVPHDIDIHEPKPPAKPAKPIREDDHEDAGDINALFAAVNDLPADDPLRNPPSQPATPATEPTPNMPAETIRQTPAASGTTSTQVPPVPSNQKASATRW